MIHLFVRVLCCCCGHFDDGNTYNSDVEDSTTLVSQPRQVEVTFSEVEEKGEIKSENEPMKVFPLWMIKEGMSLTNEQREGVKQESKTKETLASMDLKDENKSINQDDGARNLKDEHIKHYYADLVKRQKEHEEATKRELGNISTDGDVGPSCSRKRQHDDDDESEETPTAGSEDPAKETGSPKIPKRNKKQAEPDIEFTTKALDLDNETCSFFAPPKNPTLLLPANREPCNTTLPEDCHYQPEDLVILPNVMCLGEKGRRQSDESDQQRESNNEMFTSWDDDCGHFDDGNTYNSDVEDSTTLVSQPRQSIKQPQSSSSVKKIHMMYKTAIEDYFQSIIAYVTDLKEHIAKLQYQKKLLMCQVLELEKGFDKNEDLKEHIAKLQYQKELLMCQVLELEIKNEDLGEQRHLVFEDHKKQIIMLWHSCNVSIIHRTQFYMLLFKGEPADDIYVQVELRRLTWLSDPGNATPADKPARYVASSIKALKQEREYLAKRVSTKLSAKERERLYERWKIPLEGGKQMRQLQLVNRLWTDPLNPSHVKESAEIVAKLVGFCESGFAEMFALNFVNPSDKKSWMGC